MRDAPAATGRSPLTLPAGSGYNARRDGVQGREAVPADTRRIQMHRGPVPDGPRLFPRGMRRPSWRAVRRRNPPADRAPERAQAQRRRRLAAAALALGLPDRRRRPDALLICPKTDVTVTYIPWFHDQVDDGQHRVASRSRGPRSAASCASDAKYKTRGAGQGAPWSRSSSTYIPVRRADPARSWTSSGPASGPRTARRQTARRSIDASGPQAGRQPRSGSRSCCRPSCSSA